MKRSTILCLIFLLFFSLGFRLRSGVSSGIPSKIYLYGTTLVRAVPGKEIAFYDISNPAVPKERNKIPITGNHDVAVESHYMYADNNHDLVIYDIADLAKPVPIDTIRAVFTTIPVFFEGPIMEPTVRSGSSGCHGGGCSSDEMVSAPATMNSGGQRGGGQAGSMSRFVIVGDYLYCVDYSSLKVFDISDPARPQYKSNTHIGREIETIFPYNGMLFIGSQTGMYILGMSDPEAPTELGEFTHARSCDPVVAEGNRAYVTLRSGAPCGDNGDQLDIVDVSDVRNPRLLKSYPLTGPYGLAVKDGTVIVCDGSGGVVILDVRDPNNVKKIGGIDLADAYDVIISGNMMIVTAEAGVYLYDITRIDKPTQFSRLQF